MRLISEGWGALYWQPGCIDVLGYDPSHQGQRLESPRDGIAWLERHQPDHPYARVGDAFFNQALADLQAVCAAADYPLFGSLERNWLLPSAMGSIRPTCLAPASMLAGDLSLKDPILVAGFAGFLDFFPEWIADNLSEQGIPTWAALLNLEELTRRNFVNSKTLATFFENPGFVDQVIGALKGALSQPDHHGVKRIGLPAVLGINHTSQIQNQLETALGLPVFEIPTLPPSIPGLRLSRILVQEIERHRGHIFEGMRVIRGNLNDPGQIVVWSEAAARQKPHRTQACILATGGILGGGLLTDFEGVVKEAVFDLPLQLPDRRGSWLEQDFFSAIGHPIFRAGLKTDIDFHPVVEDDKPVSVNLYAVGGLLAGSDPLLERSLDGVALATGSWVGCRV